MKFSLVLFSLTISCHLIAQNYGNIWQLGGGHGLDFSNCEPTVISGSNTGFEGTATICDDLGQILFYTNSVNVWNAQDDLMPGNNFPALLASQSQTIIIPKPLSENNYYIISTPTQASENQRLRYMEIDMTMDNGLGDIAGEGNEMTDLIVTEQIAATYHSNGTDIWLMTHEYGTNSFLAFLVTSDGIDLNPVVSNVGPAQAPSLSNFNARGAIKFSPDGSKVAFNANGIGTDETTDVLCLLEFDTSTGDVFNPVNLPSGRGEFGMSFSADNTKLYGGTWKAFAFDPSDLNYLYQFDISSGDSSAIAQSKFILDSLPLSNSIGSLKLAPNGQIYVRVRGSDYLGVIESPDLSGAASSYEPNGIFLGFVQNQYGLNNYIEYQSYCSTLSTDNLEAAREKKLVRIIDLTGRECEDTPNKVLIHIYDDHSRKKVFRVEP